MIFLAMGVQSQTTTSFSKNQTAKAMALFVNDVKPAYQKEQTYKEFEKVVLGTWNNTPEGTALLVKAFEYLVKDVPSEQIIKDYNGLEFANALSITTKSKDSSTDGIEVFGGSASSSNTFSDKSTTGGCKWYQIFCYIEKASLN